MTETVIWPDGLLGYKRTPEFTEKTVPPALLRDHATKDGVWGRIHVLDGQLRFTDQETGQDALLSEGVHECVFPNRLHNVAPIGAVRFFVEFCRMAQTSDDGEGEAGLPHR